MEEECVPQMAGLLDRRTMLNFWSKRKCVLQNSTLLVFKDRTLESSLAIDDSTCVSLLDSTSCRFIVEHPNFEPLHFRAIDNDRAMAWVLALRACGFVHAELSIASFHLLTVLGQGYYGKVTLARKIDTGELFAIKSIRKQRLVDSRKVHTVLTERNILTRASHPFIVSLYFAFQTKSRFYLCLDYVPGGELFRRMNHSSAISMHDVRLYVAEIALAVRHLHSLGILYRDLKPENILLDAEGHIKLTDFGLSKTVPNSELTSTFCGTTEYMAPEIVNKMPYGMAVDWWALGILLYEMLYGRTPFACDCKAKLFRRIAQSDVPFPSDRFPSAQNLILGLLEKEPGKRFGFQQVSKHAFFDGLDFELVEAKRIRPDFAPPTTDSMDEFGGEFVGNEQVSSFDCPVLGSAGYVQGFSFEADGLAGQSSI
jgi:serine/threonine protein kinase